MGLKKYIETNNNGSYYQIFNTVPEPLVDVNRVTEGKTSPKSSPPPSNNHTSASQSSSHTYSSSNASKHMPVLQVSLGWRVMCTCMVLMIQGFFFCLCIAGFYYLHYWQEFGYEDETLILSIFLTEGCDILYNKWTPDSALWCTIKSSPAPTTFRCIIQPQDSDNTLWGWVRSPHTCTKCICKCPTSTICYTSLEQLTFFV